MDEQIPPPANEIKPRSSSCVVRGLVLVGIGLIAAIVLVLWYHRPIRPVVLTEPEIAVVETKIAEIHAAADDGPETAIETPEPDAYQPGKREIVFTDRELNGLLNERSTLGDQIAFQFNPGSVAARIQVPLQDDIPIIGGRTLRARAKLAVDASGETPMLALQDLTVWGISIPNDWLGGIKNTNLLGEAFGSGSREGIPGVESLTIEKGRILLRLKE